jgi:hypothetical protein
MRLTNILTTYTDITSGSFQFLITDQIFYTIYATRLFGSRNCQNDVQALRYSFWIRFGPQAHLLLIT